MKKEKFTILFLGLVYVLIAGFVFPNPAEAADASVYVSPASLSKNVGEMFNIVVGVNPAGEKVCAVEGTLNLDKLSCQSITLGEGMMAQSSPACGSLYFLLGIPGCSTENKELFTIKVKAKNAGTATAGFTGIDIIGEGASVSSASIGGSYTLTSVSVPTPPSEETPPPPEEEVIPEEGPAEEEVTPEEEAPAGEEGEEKIVTTAPYPGETQSLFLAAISNIFSLGTGNAFVAIFVGAVIVIILIYLLYYLRQKRVKRV